MSLLFDKLVKGPIFGCQQCGQCLLSQTGYVCPMTCPKGLRNGPCGGTVDGRCEVLPERPCVWLNIDSRIDQRPEESDGLHVPFDPTLVGTSSVKNLITGRDRPTRRPRAFAPRADGGTRFPSALAARAAAREFVITYEIASPRERSGLDRVAETAAAVRGHVDAVNTTTNAGGVPSLSSIETGRVVLEAGIEPVLQYCGRDHAPAEFERAVGEAIGEGFSNVLVLTGDWNPRTPRERDPAHWFPMDSLQMVDMLARGQARGRPRPFIGVASNAYTTPMSASLDRFAMKIEAGADFTQTQAVTEVETFGAWLTAVRANPHSRGCRIIASVPMVGKARPYEILKHLAGVKVAPSFRAAIEGAADIEQGGLAAARQVIEGLLALDIDGLHLMNFGLPVAHAVEFVEEVRALSTERGWNGAGSENGTQGRVDTGTSGSPVRAGSGGSR